MHDAMDFMERLARRARNGVPPAIDVWPGVAARLHVRESAPLAWVTLGAAMAAAAMALFVLLAPPPGTEVLDLLFQSADFIHTEGGLS
jgi:hypothetical protein